MHTRSANTALIGDVDSFAMSSRLAARPQLRSYGVMVAEAEAPREV
jgi:hypothetical protein